MNNKKYKDYGRRALQAYCSINTFWMCPNLNKSREMIDKSTADSGDGIASFAYRELDDLRYPEDKAEALSRLERAIDDLLELKIALSGD
jgi:hypothetical protein